MKNVIAVIVILCFLIAILFVVVNHQPSFSPKQPKIPELSAQRTETQPEKIADTIASPPAVTLISEPPADENNHASITTQELPTPPKDSRLNRESKTPLDSEAEVEAKIIEVQLDIQAPSVTDNQPIQGLGLLTDTGETPENQILDPQSTQVQPTFYRMAPKKAEIPQLEQRIERTGSMDIAVLPEDDYPFAILLETFGQKGNAQQAITHYHQQYDIVAYWVKVDLGLSGVKFRLFTGTFPTETAARTFIIRHHLSGKLIKKTSYTAGVGVFHDKKELTAAFTKTLEAGVFPYVLGTASGPFHLFVGAFYTVVGAESQCRELSEKGLPCKAILRSTLSQKN